MNKQRLFTASCIALIATAMSFAIRGDIMGDFEPIFQLNKTNVGWIAGAAFWGFGLSIFIGGPLCDVLGMGTIMRLAAAGHIGGTLLTIVAPNFPVLFLATVIIGIANGLVEAAVNPLIATIYDKEKTAKLTALHAWFPGGIVIGGVLAFLFTQIGLGWQAKMLLMLVPSVDLHVPVRRTDVPADRARRRRRAVRRHVQGGAAAAVPGDLGRHDADGRHRARAGAVVCQRLQRGHVQHRAGRHPRAGVGERHHVPDAAVRPAASRTRSSPIGAHRRDARSSPPRACTSSATRRRRPPPSRAAALLAVGTAFWWPTMLGITSERFPRTGALGLAIIGGTGSFATAIAGPVMGRLNDMYGPREMLRHLGDPAGAR